MQRVDFNNIDYALMFNSRDGGDELFQSLVDNTDILNTNESWALTQGRIADAPTPTDVSGHLQCGLVLTPNSHLC